MEVWDGTNRSVLSAVLSMGYPVVYAGSYYLDHLQLHWEDDLYSVDPGTFSEVLSLNCLTFSFRACLGKSSYHQVKTHYVKSRCVCLARYGRCQSRSKRYSKGWKPACGRGR